MAAVPVEVEYPAHLRKVLLDDTYVQDRFLKRGDREVLYLVAYPRVGHVQGIHGSRS